MLIRFFPVETNFDFMKVRWFAFAFSALALVFSVVEVPVRGLNFGIDFSGGLLVEVAKPDGVTLEDLRPVLSALDLNDLQLTEAAGTGVGAEDVFIIKASTVAEEGIDAEAAQQNLTDLVRGTLVENFGDVDIRRAENIGPRVSGELLQAGITALVVSLIFMVAYIWFRFEWQFSVGAVIALVHDVALTIGVFSFLQLEFNLTTIAALLTIIGYSMNDTVVVYDRVREELRKYKKLPLAEVINLAINKTLSRTILTSGTTLLALFAIYFLGGEVLRGFSFALIWGICVGTYSSIFVASALLLHTGLRADKKTGDAVTTTP